MILGQSGVRALPRIIKFTNNKTKLGTFLNDVKIIQIVFVKGEKPSHEVEHNRTIIEGVAAERNGNF